MSVTKNVLSLLELYPNLNDYNDLVFMYWSIFDGVNSTQDISEATSVETITRSFRKIKNRNIPKIIREAQNDFNIMM